MKFLKYAFPLMLVLLFTLVVAACAQQPTVPTPATSSGNPTATSSANALINTATATVKGTSTTILTNSQGMTLYYFTPDSPTSSMCTADCAATWPPLLATGSSAPASSTALSGKLTAVTDANGSQVEYNGHFLYVFSGDTAAGQTNGEGIGGKWFVATPDLH